jgi:hypothetical protein
MSRFEGKAISQPCLPAGGLMFQISNFRSGTQFRRHSDKLWGQLQNQRIRHPPDFIWMTKYAGVAIGLIDLTSHTAYRFR